MIKLTQCPTIVMDAVMYTGAVSGSETLESTIKWILKNNKKHSGTIEISFFNNQSRKGPEIKYSGNSISGNIPSDLADYSVIELSATHWGRSGTFNYEIFLMDPESKEYSAVRDEDDPPLWRDPSLEPVTPVPSHPMEDLAGDFDGDIFWKE